MNKGIDYGMGQTNIDTSNGIRFGVISVNDLMGEIWESFEADYGDPTCGKCGNEAVEYDDDKHGEYEGLHEHSMSDYACEHCEKFFGSDEAYGDEPLSHNLDDGEYKAFIDSHNDCMILKSPYYSRAQFCSPCAPGACHLGNPMPEGEKCYCLGPDWFDDDRPCEYPIYKVENDELVYEPQSAES